MTKPIKLNLQDAAHNSVKLYAHHLDAASPKHNEYGFGVWKWGHKFISLQKTDKCLYKILFSILAKIGLIKTELNDPSFITALKLETEKTMKPLYDRKIAEIPEDPRIKELSTKLLGSENDALQAKQALEIEKAAASSKIRELVEKNRSSETEKSLLKGQINLLKIEIDELKDSLQINVTEIDRLTDKLLKDTPIVSTVQEQSPKVLEVEKEALVAKQALEKEEPADTSKIQDVEENNQSIEEESPLTQQINELQAEIDQLKEELEKNEEDCDELLKEKELLKKHNEILKKDNIFLRKNNTKLQREFTKQHKQNSSKASKRQEALTEI